MSGGEPAGNVQRWADVVAAGGRVVISQRRLSSALMLAGSIGLLALTMFLVAWGRSTYSLAVSFRIPLLYPIMLFMLVCIMVTGQRLLTGGPRLAVDDAGVRYGRFHAGWNEVGPMRVANTQNVEITGKGGHRFPLDNKATEVFMRKVVSAKGSWLSAWLDADPVELADWLNAERKRRR